MIRLFTAAALSIVSAAGANGAAEAGIPLPAAAQATGMPSLAPMLKKITPAVVSIETKGHIGPEPGAKKRETREIGSVGSGVIYDASRGLIVTNNHVIDHADTMTVTLTDGRALKATRVGADPAFDLAVIKVTADNLTSIPFANSSELEVGDFVLAIGYPMQIGQSVTSGIVSGLHRRRIGIERYENFIQTDAAIYPGNSGGALVNLAGDLVGINTAFIGATNSNPGMGFAIPVNMARVIADQILEFGDIQRGTLGITTTDLTPTMLSDMKLPASQSGVVITKVDPASGGARAGLKPGDVVTGIGNRIVTDSGFLRTRMALLRIGDVAEFTVLRDGKPEIIRATVMPGESGTRSK